MAQLGEDIHSCVQKSIPEALAALNQSHTNIEKYAQYCKMIAASEPDPVGVFQKTQQYIPQALSNATYHIHTVGLQLTNFLQLQANEIDKLDLQLQVLADKMKGIHDVTGSSSYKSAEAIKGAPRQPKMAKIESYRSPERTVRQPINLACLDKVGIDSAGSRGTDSYEASFATPPPAASQTLRQARPMPTTSSSFSGQSMNAPSFEPPPTFSAPPQYDAPPMMSSPSFNAPPPAFAAPPPPPSFSTPPPPPSFSAPPPPMMTSRSFNAPPPAFAAPPPPFDENLPPAFDDYAAPPPPPFDEDLPPPFDDSDSMPPPPPPY